MTTYRYAWRKNRRPELFGRLCVVVASGKLGSVKVRWLDGGHDIVSRRALRRVAT